MNCDEQVRCEEFRWHHRMRNEHIRRVEKCDNWDGKECGLSGRSCNLEKIKRLKGEK